MVNFENIFVFNFTFIFILILSFQISLSQTQNAFDTQKLIKSYGYKYETHRMITNDGYILKMFRIINPNLKSNRNKLKPVLLQHGLFGTSSAWLIQNNGKINSENPISLSMICNGSKPNSVSDSLGFVLSACGYDVWLANSRGNRYSTNHTELNPYESDFWKFTFQQMAKYDLPSMVEYIRRKTGKDQIAYIGYSLGSTIMLAKLSSDSSFSKYFKPIILLSPVSYLGNMSSVVLRFGSLIGNLYRSNPGPFPPRFFDAWPSIFVYTDRTSNWNLAHLSQNYYNNRFAQFDYGIDENFKRYGHMIPNDYHPCNISSPNIALFYSTGDEVSDHTSADVLKRELKVPYYDYFINDSSFHHRNFITGPSLGKIINAPILKLLKLNSKNNRNLRESFKPFIYRKSKSKKSCP